jgi:[glutamine synthetase] adenylyltransferase / [glutamine synthetase]-adenylyl-L-tyrosine phosphorylase
MSSPPATEEQRLAQIGFVHLSRATQDLAAIRRHYAPSDVAAWLARCSVSIDPDSALTSLERLVSTRIDEHLPLPRARAFDVLACLGAGSEFLSRLLARRFGLAEWVAGSRFLDRPKAPESFLYELTAKVAGRAPQDTAGLARTLRRYKYREVARIAYRDLSGRVSLAEVGRELSGLATACTEIAVRFHDRILRGAYGSPNETNAGAVSGFCVLAFGKLGAEELNFSSDIDLVYVFDRDGTTQGGPSGAITCRQYFARLAEQTTRALSEVTPEGFVFRVDLALRPQGQNGPIADSVEDMERYYEAHGRTWERAALLRARPIAGDLEVGRRALAALSPFIYRRSVDLSMVGEMQAMKRGIDRQVRSHGGDVKLGKGGIREVEFFVQALQLLYAGRDERLREANTLAALEKALFSGRVRPKDRDTLAEAYQFLRRVENRIQMWGEQQTHLLPDTAEARKRLARSVGLPDAGALEAELDRHRRGVSAIFSDILVASGEEVPEVASDLVIAMDTAAPEAERAEVLAKLGFSDPTAAMVALAGLAKRDGSPFRNYGVIDPRAARLLSDAAATPDPDRALFHLADFFGSLNMPAPYFDLLARHPHTARLLVGLFGTSDFLSRYLLRHPELLDSLVRSDAAAIHKGRDVLRRELEERLRGTTEFEDRLAGVCRFKNEEVLRVGLNDVAGTLDLLDVVRELSDLADVSLEAVLSLAMKEAVERYGEPNSDSLAILGLGKLGGRELGYQSDLDLLFVYGAPGETRGGRRGVVSHQEFFATVAQKLCAAIQIPMREGTLYRVDTRLRPSGSHGTLVVSAEAFAAHQLERAQLWERQASLRTRLVVGDPSLWKRIETTALIPSLSRPIDTTAAAKEIRRLRGRMENEVSRESSDQYDPKYGPGGLTDIEFAVQYLQLCHVAKRPDLREPSTLDALEKLTREGLIGAADAAVLTDAYRFLRRLEQRMQIVHDWSEGAMPRQGRALERLARRLGYEGGSASDQLLADYQMWTTRVRVTFERVVA